MRQRTDSMKPMQNTSTDTEAHGHYFGNYRRGVEERAVPCSMSMECGFPGFPTKWECKAIIPASVFGQNKLGGNEKERAASFRYVSRGFYAASIKCTPITSGMFQWMGAITDIFSFWLLGLEGRKRLRSGSSIGCIGAGSFTVNLIVRTAGWSDLCRRQHLNACSARILQ